MNHSNQIDALAKALVAVQKELQPITKDSINPAFKSRFASLDAIMDGVRDILANHGLAIVHGGASVEAPRIGITTMLVHESGQWISSDFEMPLEKATAQGVGSAITYSRRYGVSALLGLATEEDDDGNAASQPKAAKRQAKPTTAAAAPEPVLTRESEITFGSLSGTKIKDLKDSYLQWALEEGRTFGKRTKEWQAAFREELASRDGVTA